MKLVEYFRVEESPYHPNEYVIKLNFEKLPLEVTSGSYGILAARTMNLKYGDYCRMCRDLFGATIRGKGTKYLTCYFPKESKQTLNLLVRILNKRMQYIMMLRESTLDEKQEAKWRTEYEEIFGQVPTY